MASVFALPVPSSHPLPFASPAKSVKRKRAQDDKAAPLNDEKTQNDGVEEYVAVITPDERAQRRLAGHSLLRELPPKPFPHRGPYRSKSSSDQIQAKKGEKQSLRLQHLSAITAILHKSLMNKDYTRARRALGLILRTDIHGRQVDIRAAGNWAIGAEILLHQFEQQHDAESGMDNTKAQLRAGFGHAKQLYEMLIVQYPAHKSHPDSINAIDFYLAMFNLWIYVVHVESQGLRHGGREDPDMLTSDEFADLRAVRMKELQEAKDIAARMDKCLGGPPFSDNESLLRLRAMVAEWQVDLGNLCSDLLPDANGTAFDSPNNTSNMLAEVQNLSLDDDRASATQHLSQASMEARDRADKIYDRLGRP